METMRSCLQSSYDLAEIYSPPRVVTESKSMGMKGGFSLDFTTPESDGYVWDFGLHECRQRAFKMVRETRPYTITGSPECTPFSTIQNMNMRSPEGKAKVEGSRRTRSTRSFAARSTCCRRGPPGISSTITH